MGDKIFEADCAVCTIPAARARCRFGTRSVVDAEYAGHWKVLKEEEANEVM
jgi:hypothetical protein